MPRFGMGRSRETWVQKQDRLVAEAKTREDKKTRELHRSQGFHSVPDPCNECGSKAHQDHRCFFANPDLLKKYLDSNPEHVERWNRKLKKHAKNKAKAAEKATSTAAGNEDQQIKESDWAVPDGGKDFRKIKGGSKV